MMRRAYKHFLETKIPPPVVLVIFAGIIWLVGRITPGLDFEFPFRSLIINGFALVGGMISTLGFVAIKLARTTINPMKPDSASTLVNTGIYRRTRNPMYLGLFLLLFAWALFLANWLAVLFPPLFIAYMNRFQIEPEERALASKFGQEFAAYKANVRRWI